MTTTEIHTFMRPPNTPWEIGLRQFANDHIHPGMTIAEIGSAAGNSSRIFAQAMEGDGRLICVDNWTSDVVWPGWDHVEAKRHFESVAREFRVIETMEMTSVEAAKKIPDRSLDLVYIDADHRYEAVREDLAAWVPKVRSGGIISGHDFHKGHPGVVVAVCDMFGEVAAIYPDNSWVVRKGE